VSLEIELRFGDQVRQRSCTHLDVSLHSLLALATHTVNPVKEPLVPVINCQVSAEFEGCGVLTNRKETVRSKITRPMCHRNRNKNNTTQIQPDKTRFIFKFQKL
jgi:hypothetical protein